MVSRLDVKKDDLKDVMKVALKDVMKRRWMLS